MSSLLHTINQTKLYFLRNAERLNALKVGTAMAIQIIPLALLGNPYIGITLVLGTLAAALSETDDHPQGRLKALLLTLISFAITTTSVLVLKPFPLIFGVGLVASTIIFVLIGGMGERYRGISFGAILVGIYAMLGAEHSPNWYLSPLLLCTGALFYGIVSWLFLRMHPWRLLNEQLARGFQALSVYLEEKAHLFPGLDAKEKEVGQRLAMLNINVVIALEKCKAVINSYSQEETDTSVLAPYLQRFMLLQSLHERAASSQERYEVLKQRTEYKQILEGFGELLNQLAKAMNMLALSMLTNQKYEHPVAINWIIIALEREINSMAEEDKQLLILLLHNLTRSHESLLQLDNIDKSTALPRLGIDQRTLWQRIKVQLHWSHPRLKYAIRLSACFIAGLIIIQTFQLVKGEWILLTALLVNQPTYSETRRRLYQRVMGTIVGVVVGVIIIQILPTQAGQILLLLTAGFCFFYYRVLNYSLAVSFITIFVLCNNNLMDHSGVEKMLPRILDTIIGAALAILSIRLLWPDWQEKQLPKKLSSALLNNASYFKEIRVAYQNNTVAQQDDYNYRLARRLAHVSDNDLSLTWSSMRVEPKKQEELMQHAFTITYLNHVLLSYLSALGARRETTTQTCDDFNNIVNQIEEALLEAAQYINGDRTQPLDWNLKALLVELSNRIKSMDDQSERQQLRLLYNIAGVSNKLLKESVMLCPTSKNIT